MLKAFRGKPLHWSAVRRQQERVSRCGCAVGCDGVQIVDASLKRLRADYIDLYQIRRFDPETPNYRPLLPLLGL
jgi:hypothetical protein